MTLSEVMDHIFAGPADIGKDPDIDRAAGYHKAMRIGCIVQFGKRRYCQAPDLKRIICPKRNHFIFLYLYVPVTKRLGCDINWKLVFFGKRGDPVNVVTMLMRHENSLNLFDIQPQSLHALFGLPA